LLHRIARTTCRTDVARTAVSIPSTRVDSGALRAFESIQSAINMKSTFRCFQPFLAMLALAVGVATSGACSSEEANEEPYEATDVPLLGRDCDPLVPTQCGMPFPSNVYLVDDPKTKTGKRVAFGAKTLPQWAGNRYVDPKFWHDSDGFSASGPILAHLPGATIEGLPDEDSIPISITKESPTIILDTETGELVPHFSELDASHPQEEQTDHAMIIRPVQRLKDARRYIVAIRNVQGEDGKALPPSPAFKALRDGGGGSAPWIARRRDLYADIFDRLEKAGIPKGNLQLAWDFSTASRENNTRWMLKMRDEALALVGDEGPEYRVVEVLENPNEVTAKRITVKMKTPLYLDKPTAGGRMVFGDDGMPKQNGFAEFDVLIHVPKKAFESNEPAALLQNGHGLLGSRREGTDWYLDDFANEKNYVAFSVDFVGMAGDDVDVIANTVVGDIGELRYVFDRQHQGVINSLLAMRMMKGRFAKDPLVQKDGRSVIDTTKRYYRGDSQGGIFGTTYMALTQDVTRGLLGEPGMPYNILLNRSVDFNFFFFLLQTAYRNGRDLQLVLAIAQMHWDRTEPSGYAEYITKDMFPNTPAHEVLIHVAIGDFQVTPLGAHIIGRSVGAKNLGPVNRPIFGLPEVTGPQTGSTLVEFEFGLPKVPKTNIPPRGKPEDDPHDKVRVLRAAIEQSDKFFRQGITENFCDGPCNPE
jgi:hypothetical protein